MINTSVINFLIRIQPLFGTKKEPEEKSEASNATESSTESKPEGEEVSERENSLKEENEKLIARVVEIDDKFKRALAEGENTRVRMRRQIEEAKIYGIQSFCKDLLEVADVLEKAIDTVPKDEVDKNEILKNLFTGVQMTEKQLKSVFKRHGLSTINPVGEKFNPNEHHAMFEAEVSGREPGTVAEVIKIGYRLHERTIRPAMVGVVKAK